MVEKDRRESSTSTKITQLMGKERIGEIARMLAGDQEGPTSLAHAAELIDKNRIQQG